MRHDLVTLNLLLATARTRSITRGAKSVHLALAAASKRIADLEVRMGVRLFNRKARGAEPTTQCQALLKHIEAVQAALNSFNSEALEFANGVKGFAKIAVTRDAYLEALPREIGAFSRRHRDVRIALSEASNVDVMESVCNGDADLGLFIHAGQSTRLLTWPYSRGRWMALLPEGHVLAAQPQVTLDDLEAFDLIGSCGPGPLKTLVERTALQRNLYLKMRIDTGGMDATAALVEAGAGVALATEVTARQWATRYRLRIVPVGEDWADYEVVVGIARQDPLPVMLRRLVDSLRLVESEEERRVA